MESTLKFLMEGLAKLTRNLAVELWREFKPVYTSPHDWTRVQPELSEPVWAIMRAFRAKAIALTERVITQVASLHGLARPFFRPDPEGYSRQAVEKVFRYNVKGQPALAFLKMLAAFSRHLRAASRQTVMRAAEDSTLGADSSAADRILGTESTQPGQSFIKPPAPELEPQQEPEDSALAPVEVVEGRNQDSSEEELDFFKQIDPVVEARLSPVFDEQPGEDFKTSGHNGPEFPTDRYGRSPFGWARVLTGAENCGFCILLAARGPIYQSQRTAEYISDSKAAKRNTLGKNKLRHEYHDRCDCIVVPVFTSKQWPGKESYEKARAFYDYFAVEKKLKGKDLIMEMNRTVDIMKNRGLILDVPQIRPGAGWQDKDWHWPPQNLPSTDLPEPINHIITDQEFHHIWYGEPDKLDKGGHGPGTGRHLKTEFPTTWTPEKAREAINHAIKDPDVYTHEVDPRGNATFEAYKLIDDVVVYTRLLKKPNKPWEMHSGYPWRGINTYVNLGNKPLLRAPLYGDFLTEKFKNGDTTLYTRNG